MLSDDDVAPLAPSDMALLLNDGYASMMQAGNRMAMLANDSLDWADDDAVGNLALFRLDDSRDRKAMNLPTCSPRGFCF